MYVSGSAVAEHFQRIQKSCTARLLMCLQVICGRWDDASYRARRCPPDEFNRRFAVHGVDRVWRCSTVTHTTRWHEMRTPQDACNSSGAAQIADFFLCSHCGGLELTASLHRTFAGTMCCHVGRTVGDRHAHLLPVPLLSCTFVAVHHRVVRLDPATAL